MTFADRINAFNASLAFPYPLPEGVFVMNPFRENACATPASQAFYRKYYVDDQPRLAILGINPGRFGAGITGVPFTDPVRLAEVCDIHIPQCPPAHEPSSVFVYDLVAAMGGPEKFYSRWYINSVCPLGFVRKGPNGRQTNYNYYDNKALEASALPFILETLPRQLALGLDTRVCFCFGKDKNFRFLNRLNQKHGFFAKIIPLDHPRFIAQYRRAQMAEYVQRYCDLLRQAEDSLI